MRRRRWAPLAAACLVALVVLLATVHGGGAPMPAARRWGASVRGRARVAAFDACKKQWNRAGAACAGMPGGGGGDDDKRVVPTGSNPLHNR
ncbi:hypothetical protein BDA96_04G046500 [Sorghum bicolor]|jgi:hypothetical protein|uniref:Uncharacterized protein n=2 Tax=Sorghum bicolor TaxID=4558 RepID=A0A921R3G1_SORBI|nr:hypothetical protein BDA96_04G046500 [Sorghum bicolor]KXG29475.1 hypothetical protein SORBI_3004G041700 [Sorghum bicolor]